jgi:putative salt-induced outer membrane protein YdiY
VREMTRILSFGVVFLSIVLSLSAAAEADQITLKNGDRLTGTAQEVKSGTLKFDSPVLGSLKIPIAEIETLSTDDLVTVAFPDGSSATGMLSDGDMGTATLTGENNHVETVPLDTIDALYQGTEIPAPKFTWRGHVDFGASQSTGNSDNKKFNLYSQTKGRGQTDRVTFIAEYNHETSGSTVDSDDALLSGKYDRFLTETLYLTGFLGVNRDETQDLNLRSVLSPGVGYQIIDTEDTELSVEAGPTWVREDYILAHDRDFAAGRWALDYQEYFFDKFVVLFHKQDGLLDFENSGDILLRTRQGIRIPLQNNLNVSAQILFDYDTNPAPGTEKEDIEYILSLGYTF